MTNLLIKGSRFNVSKAAPQVQKLAIGLGWKVPRNEQSYEVDASIFMLGNEGKIPEERYFVFYNNLISFDESVRHLGYNKAEFSGQDEQTIFVDLAKVNPAIQEILIVVTIHEAKEKHQNFSQVKNAYIRLYNQLTGEEFTRYNLEDEFSKERAVEFGKLYQKDGEWRFQAVGTGYNSGLKKFVDQYYGETHSPTSSSLTLGENFQITPVNILSQQVNQILADKSITDFRARLGLVIELSDATKPLYGNGNLQTMLERLLAIANCLSQGAEMDVWGFCETSIRLNSLTANNLEQYINREITPNFTKVGNPKTQNYSPVLIDILQKFLQEKPRNYPSFVIILGAGGCNDPQRAELAIKSASKYAIFWQFAGLSADLSIQPLTSRQNFDILKHLDTMDNRIVDNANFVEINHFSLADEQEFYNKILNELPYWLIDAQAKNIV